MKLSDMPDLERMSQNRESFLQNGELSDRDIPPEIYDSWQRSKDFRVNPYSLVLSPPRKQKTNVIDKYRTNINHQLIQTLREHLDDNKMALFLLNNDLKVFWVSGNKNLLSELDLINLGIGSKLAEEVVGTNAAALAARDQSESCVIGSQHYIEAFQKYASCAVAWVNENDIIDYAMFVTYKNNFHPSMLGFLHFLQSATNINFALEQKNLECILSEEIIRLGIQQQKEGLLYVDPRGIIIKANLFMAEALGLPTVKIIGNRIEEILPELTEAIEGIKAGEGSYLHEVYLQHSTKIKKHYFIKCQQIRNEGKYVGLIINCKNNKVLYNEIATVASFKAYFTFNDLIGTNRNFLTVVNMAKNAALSSSNVLIEGESGTGKELFAQSIHNLSSRHNSPFISINCAAIPRELIGSELFGYMDGAFTGARRGGAPGKFELAHKGTILLDEIGEMPLDMQVVLLRVLEERRITRLGGSNSNHVDVRIIAATNKNLRQLVDEGQFRSDLYYRLNVINLEIPPLSERKEDILLMADYFLEKLSLALGKNVTGYTNEVLNLLSHYTWPGNIRELRNVIERGVNICTSSILTVHDLPKIFTENSVPTINSDTKINKYFKPKDEGNEKLIIQELLKEYNGNKAYVAKKLGISRPTLYRKLCKFEIE